MKFPNKNKKKLQKKKSPEEEAQEELEAFERFEGNDANGGLIKDKHKNRNSQDDHGNGDGDDYDDSVTELQDSDGLSFGFAEKRRPRPAKEESNSSVKGSDGSKSKSGNEEGEGEGEDEEGFMHAIRPKKTHSGGFQTMGLSKNLLQAVLKKGYKVPTPIQRKCIPIILEGKDVVGMARTGSGKTAAFLVPLMEKLKSHTSKVGVRGIILSPSRELALQTLKFAKELSKFTDLRCALLVGGDSLEDQFVQMTSNPDIVIGTPGRFLHLVVEMDLSLKSVEYVVFDEADRLFESGFATQLHEILGKLPESRQTLLFSATLPKLLVEFAKAGLSDPVLVRLDTDVKISSELEMAFLSMTKEDKIPFLLFMLREMIDPERLTIIFVSTKHHVEYLQRILNEAGISTTYIYGALDQTARKINLAKFRAGKTKVLLVTDVASRGLDVPLLDYVINFDFPPSPKLFVHRVGRAARAGRMGFAYSFVSQEELPYLMDLQLFLGRPLVMKAQEDELDLKTTISYGAIPRNVLQFTMEEFNQMLQQNVDIHNLQNVVSNAFKLYCKSRPLASSQSYVRAKEIYEGSIDVHPLFKKFVNATEQKVEEFIRGIRSFRPPETVFELGRKKTEESIMKLKREKDDKKIKAKSLAESLDEQIKEKHENKKKEIIIQQADEDLVGQSFKTILGRKPKTETPLPSHRDENYYIPYQPADQNTEKGYAMKEGNFLEQSRNVEIDITGEDESQMRAKKNMTVWDRKKKKFVKASSIKDKEAKKKNEAGKVINSSYKTNFFEEWKAKNRINLTTAPDVAVQMTRRWDGKWVPKRNFNEISAGNNNNDDNDRGDSDNDNQGPPKKKFKGKGGNIRSDNKENNQEKGKGKGGFSGKGGFGGKGNNNYNKDNGDGGKQKQAGPGSGKKKFGTVTKGSKKVKSELKTVEQIRKQRKIKERRERQVGKAKRIAQRNKGRKGK